MHLMDKLGQSIVHINRLYEQWAKQQGISNSNLLWVYHSLIHHQNRTQQEICDEFDIAKNPIATVQRASGARYPRNFAYLHR